MNTDIHFRSYLDQSFLQQQMFHTRVVEKIKTHILCSVTFFEIRTVYEIMWKNNVQGDRSHITIWRTRIACLITKTTNTHIQVV